MCDWISFFGPFALIAFALAQALLAFCFASFCARIIPDSNRFLFYAFFWVAFEWVLGHLPIIAFPWLTLSTSLVDISLVRPAVRFGGGVMLSFLVVLVGGLCVDILRGYKNSKIVLTAVFVLIIVALSVGPIQLGPDPKSVSLTVVQGNDKNRYLTQEELNDNYLEKSHLQLAQEISNKRDIIIFPESAFNSDPRNDDELLNNLVPIAAKTKRLLLLNTIASEEKGDFNRNYFFSPEMEELGYYDKKRLVPFGEYVPLENLIGKWGLFDRIGTGFKPGSNNKTVKGITTLICFESAFTVDVQRALTSDSQLLVITTNNRSYRRSGNSEQHLALSQLRAAEFGIGVVQASVSGVSAFIERDGSVEKHTDLFEKTNLSGTLSFGHPDSIYSKTGDWLSLCALLVVGYLSIRKLRKLLWKNRTQNV